jgi:hypothetical protein
VSDEHAREQRAEALEQAAFLEAEDEPEIGLDAEREVGWNEDGDRLAWDLEGDDRQEGRT